MSSSQKTGLARKTGTALLGAALLSSLVLTACGAPASTTADSKSAPSESASVSETPTGITSFKSEAFDLSKQVSTDVKRADSNILLGNGAVTHAVDGGKVLILFTPYEDKGLAWEYVTDVELTESTAVELMRWKDKSYLVVSGHKVSTEAASGLTAEKKTNEEHVIVLDAATGKVANHFKGDAYPSGSSDNERFFFNPRVHSYNNQDTAIPFQTGLIYRTSKGGAKLVDPVTGGTVATYFQDYGKVPLNNETGFYKDNVTGPSVSTTKSVFGNFAFVSEENPPVKSQNGGNYQNSTFTLIDTTTNKVVSEMNCAGTGASELKPAHSADFRYVVFAEQYVFDTKTGESFCASPTGKENVRQLKISAVDNKGNFYASAGSEYMRISLADNAKIETLSKLEGNNPKLPILITDKGSALFYSEKSANTLVAVPAKE